MNRFLLAVGIGVSLLATPVLAMSDAECTAAWANIDTQNSGTVGEPVAAQYFAALRLANTPVADGKLTRAAFLKHCQAGLFDKTVVEAGAPLSGANSFTEAQAKDRVLASGYLNVSALTKDANGVWRGTVSDGTKTMKIAVDFKGNVVAN